MKLMDVVWCMSEGFKLDCLPFLRNGSRKFYDLEVLLAPKRFVLNGQLLMDTNWNEDEKLTKLISARVVFSMSCCFYFRWNEFSKRRWRKLQKLLSWLKNLLKDLLLIKNDVIFIRGSIPFKFKHLKLMINNCRLSQDYRVLHNFLLWWQLIRFNHVTCDDGFQGSNSHNFWVEIVKFHFFWKCAKCSLSIPPPPSPPLVHN